MRLRQSAGARQAVPGAATAADMVGRMCRFLFVVPSLSGGPQAGQGSTMHQASTTAPQPKRHRPQGLTVFLAAFVAGAAAAVGINQALDVHLAQKKPQVESEPIFVALRSLPQGSPVTIWDVALRDWPKAMLPMTALRAEDSFEGCVLRHPLREGQPLLTVQLMRAGQTAHADPPPTDTTFTLPTPAAPVARPVEADLWTPAPAATPGSTPPGAPGRVAMAQPGIVAPPQATSPDVAPPAQAVASPAIDAPRGAVAAPVAVAATPVAAEPAPVFVEPIAVPVEPTPVVDDEPSPPVVASGEPTVAEPLPGEPTPADTPPPADVGIESVVAAQSVTTPADGSATPAVEPMAADPGGDAPATTPARKPRDGITRYLVVPERIALQADAGFAEPSAVQPPAAAPQPDVASLPPVRQNTTAQAQPKPTAQQRSAQQARPTARPQPAPQGRQQQPAQPRRQPTSPGTRQATTTGPRGLGAMFPKLAAGIDAMTGGGREPRDAADRFDEAVATDDPSYRP